MVTATWLQWFRDHRTFCRVFIYVCLGVPQGCEWNRIPGYVVFGTRYRGAFRSYENMFYFLYHLAETHWQKCRLNFLIEKHGGSMCDWEFSPVRRWLSKFLLNREGFCDKELDVVKVLQDYARREERQNPDGMKFIIKLYNPDKRELCFGDDHLITRSQSLESEPTSLTRFRVKISNCVFSPSATPARFLVPSSIKCSKEVWVYWPGVLAFFKISFLSLPPVQWSKGFTSVQNLVVEEENGAVDIGHSPHGANRLYNQATYQWDQKIRYPGGFNSVILAPQTKND